MPKIVFYLAVTLLYYKVKIKGRSQGHGSKLPSAAKSNKSYYQSKVGVCNQWPYADNCTDAVDQLLFVYIYFVDGALHSCRPESVP